MGRAFDAPSQECHCPLPLLYSVAKIAFPWWSWTANRFSFNSETVSGCQHYVCFMNVSAFLLHGAEWSVRNLGTLFSPLYSTADPSMMPKMQVDRGAVRFVLRGSNVMCPGLTSPGGRMEEVSANSVVVSAAPAGCSEFFMRQRGT